jgi:hypothetical protein
MAKKRKSSIPAWLVVLGAGAVWYFWPSSASAAVTTTTTVSAGAAPYMAQIVAAQTAFQAGTQTQAQYTASAQAILAKALADTAVSSTDMTTLHAVSGV